MLPLDVGISEISKNSDSYRAAWMAYVFGRWLVSYTGTVELPIAVSISTKIVCQPSS